MRHSTHLRYRALALALSTASSIGSLPAHAAIYTVSGNFIMFDSIGGQAGVTDSTLSGTYDDTDQNSLSIITTQLFFGLPWTAHDLVINTTPGTYTVETCPTPSDGSTTCTTPTPATMTVNTGQWGINMLFNWGVTFNIDVLNVWDVTYNTDATINLVSTDIDSNGIIGLGMVDGPFTSNGGFSANFNLTLTPVFNTNLQIFQNGNTTSVVDVASGAVDIKSGVTDAANFTYNWNNGFTNADIIALAGNTTTAETLTLDPSSLAPGDYEISLSMTSLSLSSTIRADTSFSIPSVSLLPKDTDGDGINDDDAAEGFGDDNENGIPNYLDNNGYTDLSQLQTSITGDTSSASILKVSSGALQVGSLAAKKFNSASESQNFYTNGVGNGHGPNINISDLTIDPNVINSCIGGCFDFKITNLSIGKGISITIPLSSAIPSNAVYRKFVNNNWKGFQINSDNKVFSATSISTSPTVCPEPESATYTEGLKEGDLCIQLTMNDGGPNDADNNANGTILDPGGIASTNQSNLENTSPAINGSGNTLWLLLVFPILITLRHFKNKSYDFLI